MSAICFKNRVFFRKDIEKDVTWLTITFFYAPNWQEKRLFNKTYEVVSIKLDAYLQKNL